MVRQFGGGVESRASRWGLFGKQVFGGDKVVNHIEFELAPRVKDQLLNSKLGSLAGKLDSRSLNMLARNPKAQFFYDAGTDNINIIQKVDSTLLRITTAGDSFKIISVGPVQERNIINSIKNRRFIPIGNQLQESLEIESYMNRIR